LVTECSEQKKQIHFQSSSAGAQRKELMARNNSDNILAKASCLQSGKLSQRGRGCCFLNSRRQQRENSPHLELKTWLNLYTEGATAVALHPRVNPT